MKALIRAEVECTDESVGGWLDCYAEGRLDERRRAAFRAHLCECLQCMALYNVETKHKHGYIDPERTGTRRVKVLLLELLPSPAQLLAALSLLVVVGSFATTHNTSYMLPQETAKEEPEKQPDELSAPPSSSPPPLEAAGALKPAGPPESKREHAGRGDDPRPAPTPEQALDATLGGGVDAATASTPPPKPTRTPEPAGVDKVATREESQEIPTEYDDIRDPGEPFRLSHSIGTFTGVSLTEEESTQGTEPLKENPPPELQPGGDDGDSDSHTNKGYFGKCGSDNNF